MSSIRITNVDAANHNNNNTTTNNNTNQNNNNNNSSGSSNNKERGITRGRHASKGNPRALAAVRCTHIATNVPNAAAVPGEISEVGVLTTPCTIGGTDVGRVCMMKSRHEFANPTSALVVSTSAAECPDVWLTTNSASGNARWRSHAVVIGQTTSYRPCTMKVGMCRILSIFAFFRLKPCFDEKISQVLS